MGLRKFFKKKIISYGVPQWGAPYLRRRFTAPPIVIGGCGRSGTTLLLSVLGAHPHIFAIDEETEALCPTAHREEKVVLETPLNINKLYWYLLTHRKPRSCSRWCEKTPKNVVFFGRILDYFGANVRILHIVRDGRDVITSKHPDIPGNYWVPPDRWIRDVSAGMQYDDHPQVHVVKYEDLVGKPELTIRALCAFIDEPFIEELLTYFKHTSVKTDRAWFSDAQPFHQQSIGRWHGLENSERIEKFMNDTRATRLLKHYQYL